MSDEKVGLRQRIVHAWNVFRQKDQEKIYRSDLGPSYSIQPYRVRQRGGNERSIIASIYTRIGIDAAAVHIIHAQMDDNDRYIGPVEHSGLNTIFGTEANIDQTSRAMIQDLVGTLCEEGVAALVPVNTNFDPKITGGYNILSVRVGRIIEWFPRHVRINLYNEDTGKREDILIPKSIVAIIPNPLYDVMNEPNSTLKRLIHKLALLDAVDDKTTSGKLDLVISLPYAVKTELQQKQAEERRKALEEQLQNSRYGVAYLDASEKLTQLNRPVENNLMAQIEYLTSMLYSQLGLTKEVFEGTADEKTMLNYYNRTIEPIVSAICDECNRKFLTKTARSQHQKIVFFRDLFKWASLDALVNFGSQFTMNEIVAPNEVRQVIGFKPSDNPEADELRNRNINTAPTGGTVTDQADSSDDDGRKTVKEIFQNVRKGQEK